MSIDHIELRDDVILAAAITLMDSGAMYFGAPAQLAVDVAKEVLRAAADQSQSPDPAIAKLPSVHGTCLSWILPRD